MSTRNYTDEQLCEMIGKYRELERDISGRVEELYVEWNHVEDEICRMVSISSLRPDRIEERTRVKFPADLEIVWEKKERTMKEFRRELEIGIQQQMELLEDIRKIYLCYLNLPYEHHKILQKLYEEKIPWKMISQQMERSKMTILKKRKQALDMIRQGMAKEELCQVSEKKGSVF